MDATWKALADPTRRDVLDQLAKEPRTTGWLVERYPELCRTAVMKHLDVLEAAGLLLVRRKGRVRWNHINPIPIQRVYDRWVSKHVQGVASAMTRLKKHVESEPTPTTDRRRGQTRDNSGRTAPKGKKR